MSDMLVRLYDLPGLEPVLEDLKRREGISIVRPMCMDRPAVVDWVKGRFSEGWALQVEKAFTHTPISCFIAVKDKKVLGFGCYDSTCRNFFGPTGVDESQRGKGIGKAVLLACLHAMAWDGYGYAIIGWVGPVDFYQKAVDAVVIEKSEPGVYGNRLG